MYLIKKALKSKNYDYEDVEMMCVEADSTEAKEILTAIAERFYKIQES